MQHHITLSDIEAQDKIYRLNLINSVSGYKSAQLIGTRSEAGKENLAVFSSVIHLGSNPPYIGFILRPTTVPRHSYSNFKAHGSFSLNAITADQIAAAHHSSASYPEGISEFEKTGLVAETKAGTHIPFVKGSPIQLLCSYENEYLIKENNTLLIVGMIQELFIDEGLLLEDGWVQLDKGKIVSINGLDGYALPQLLDRFPYARPKTD
ncbi:flavin reductase [Flavobacteriaceae bacterium]|jgi:flavin reductase (DIM6/NTAB) family NADH-FMN oxidoreductase RutF|nr:flavin oxidoreductase [Flavobacteriaceae bacterium]MDA7711977.1 flavin reductase [Flavobacteriaceae bacterium]